MFIDLAHIQLEAGKGGDGLVSFRREKYISKGGPNGGDGGDGGSIIFCASSHQYDLNKFRFIKLIKAKDGQAGQSSRKKGKTADDVLVEVPVGTVISNLETGQLLVDLAKDKQRLTIARGGQGGFGNAHFKSSTKRLPLVAEKGLKGQSLKIKCELKLLAEAGLIGLPNAGKSTFLQTTTQAHPKIAAYPFTTLEPYLGVTFNNCLLADIPGLITGASQGKGLGYQFLRHIERTLVLLHLIDIQTVNPIKSYQQINRELKAYNPQLLKRPALVVLTKIDLISETELQKKRVLFKRILPDSSQLYAISALSNLNIKRLLVDLKRLINQQKQLLRKKETAGEKEALTVFELKTEPRDFTIVKDKQYFWIQGVKIEKFALKTDLDNFHARQRLRDIMQKMGITRELFRQGYSQQPIIFGSQKLGPFYLDENQG